MIKMQSMTKSNATFFPIISKHTSVSRVNPSEVAQSSLRVNVLSSSRVHIMIESVRGIHPRLQERRQDPTSTRNRLLFLNCHSMASLSEPTTASPGNRLVNCVCAKHVMSYQVNSNLYDSGESLQCRHLMQGPDKELWKLLLANDLRYLSQEVGSRVTNITNTIIFIYPSKTRSNK